jgi:hypothetical protein
MLREQRLAQYLHEHALDAFRWEGWNCCNFASDWVRRATGFNPMQGLPSVRSKVTAYRLLGQFGGLGAAWTKQLGREPINPRLAQAGDIVLVECEGVELVGICTGRLVAVLTEAHGVGYLDMNDATAAWRLECGH